MRARLVGISGPLAGVSIEVGDGETVLGREAAGGVIIPDRVVSRRHCVISLENGRFRIRDAGSANGTFVNGLPVQERDLDLGDQIRIGNCVLQFSPLEEHDPGRNSTLFGEGSWTAGSVVVLPNAESRYLLPETASGVNRTERDLKLLLKIGAAIPAIRSMEAIQHYLLQSVFEVIPAGYGAILLRNAGGEQLGPELRLCRRGQRGPAPKVSQAVVKKVLTERVAMLQNDIQDAGAFRTLIEQQVTCMLAAPMACLDRALGVIYLDSTDPWARFDEDHLELLAAIAGIAAPALHHALDLEQLEGEIRRLQAELAIEHDMIGQSPPMQAVYDFVARVAPTWSTVFIRGESGVGKELVARAIHRNGPRVNKPFVAINCAAPTEGLLGSEMFGYEKGAFTGAVAQKRGKIEEAEGGTVFLDEIGELAPALQARLLRVLQLREFERVGGTRTVRADVRVIAASNRDLEAAVREGAFRQDLYYRLNVVSVTVPPLRERREDIAPLASHFARVYARVVNRNVAGISEEARACLTSYDWPGNVRELENAIERAVVLGSTPMIVPEDLPDAVAEANRAPGVRPYGFHEAVKQARQRIILEAIERADGDIDQAAKALGLHPNNLYRLVRNLDLKDRVAH